MNMTYGLWAFEISQRTQNSWGALSMVPFVIAVLRYAVDVDSGKAGAPDDLARTDHILQILGVVWLGTLTLAIYV
jgi:decaprenyl-phosphate phosphoribosyltransferase